MAFAVVAAGGLLAAAAERTLGDEFASAIDRGDVLAVKALVEDGANPDTPIAYGENKVTPLARAAGRGKRDIVRYLLSKGAKVNAPTTDGETALMEAVKSGFDDIVTMLIAAGADIKARDGRGNTAFSLAVFGAHLEIADALIAKGADPNAVDGNGFTPLLGAASMGNEDVLRYLVGKGAKVNAVGQIEYGGTTALTTAARVGQVASVKTLLELGADPRLKMKGGATALSNAQQSGNEEVIALIKAALARPLPAKAPAKSPPPVQKP